MKLNKMPKSELELLSYADIAYELLKLDKKPKTTPVLFKEVCSLLEINEDAMFEMIGDFYTTLTTDKRFILLDNAEWDLKEFHSVAKIVDEEEKIRLTNIAKKYLPDNWDDGYKNVEIKVLKTKEDMQVVSLDKVAMMTQSEKDILWDYCMNLLKTWKGNDVALNHSESFLVGYCYLLKGKEEDIKNALLNRYSEEEVNRFLILGKDISKRGIPIYKELT